MKIPYDKGQVEVRHSLTAYGFVLRMSVCVCVYLQLYTAWNNIIIPQSWMHFIRNILFYSHVYILFVFIFYPFFCSLHLLLLCLDGIVCIDFYSHRSRACEVEEWLRTCSSHTFFFLLAVAVVVLLSFIWVKFECQIFFSRRVLFSSQSACTSAFYLFSFNNYMKPTKQCDCCVYILHVLRY